MIDLQQFCAPADDPRLHLTKPWSRGEFTYAASGYIMVRVPRVDGIEDNAAAPDCDKLLAQFDFAAAQWLPVPEQKDPGYILCDVCDGTGERDCPHCGQDMECDKCEDGKVYDYSAIPIGDSRYQKRFLALIQGWEISPNGLDKAGLIRNGDAIGLLMPKSRD